MADLAFSVNPGNDRTLPEDYKTVQPAAANVRRQK
jgi:hypothetical protein